MEERLKIYINKLLRNRKLLLLRHREKYQGRQRNSLNKVKVQSWIDELSLIGECKKSLYNQ